MRWLLRMLIFWVIAGPLFYMFGLPLLLEKLTSKTRTESFAQCRKHLHDQNMIGGPPKLSIDQGDRYCHCVSDGLTLTQDDLVEQLKTGAMATLQQRSQGVADDCNQKLQAEIMPGLSQQPTAPAPLEDGLGVHTKE